MHNTDETLHSLHKTYFLQTLLSNTVHCHWFKVWKKFISLARSFSRVSAHLLLLVYKTYFAKTNIAGKKCVRVRTCPQKLYYCSF